MDKWGRIPLLKEEDTGNSRLKVRPFFIFLMILVIFISFYVVIKNQ